MNKGKPDDIRVNLLAKKLPGIERHSVQQLLYIEETCRSILGSIARLEASEIEHGDLNLEKRKNIEEIKNDLRFLETLIAEKRFLVPNVVTR